MFYYKKNCYFHIQQMIKWLHLQPKLNMNIHLNQIEI